MFSSVSKCVQEIFSNNSLSVKKKKKHKQKTNPNTNSLLLILFFFVQLNFNREFSSLTNDGMPCLGRPVDSISVCRDITSVYSALSQLLLYMNRL